MLRALQRRGPDGEGFTFVDTSRSRSFDYSSERSPDLIKELYPQLDFQKPLPQHNLALAHVRFSISDPTANGHQPMWSACRAYCVTFNGEIYNYLELRRELEANGCRFLTNCDTEILLHAYKMYGVQFIRRLNGFFAFALYDAHLGKVLLARDRIGVANLYILASSTRCVWASEIKAFLTAKLLDPYAIDPSKVADFILNSRRDRSGTFWPDVIDFPPGHYAYIDTHCHLDFVKYWTLPKRRRSKQEISLSDATTVLRDLLVDAISIRIPADVQYGFELSGGLDSSTLVSLAAGGMGKKFTTFTVKYDRSDLDEEHYARSVAEMYPSNINYTLLHPHASDFWSTANNFVWEQEEPFHSPNLRTSQSMHQQFKAAGVDVIISGAAGDELLAGYPFDYMGAYLRYLLRTSDFLELARFLSTRYEISVRDSLKALIVESFLPHETRISLLMQRTGVSTLLSKVLSKVVLQSKIDIPDIDLDNSFEGRTISNLSSRMMNYWTRSGPKSSYTVPVEVRMPFLDYRLVEFCSTLPPQYLLSRGYTKFLLRKVSEPFMPPEVTWRNTKLGFPFPLVEWLTRSKQNVLLNLHNLNCPFIDSSELAANYDNLVHVAPQTLWNIISVVLWWRRVVEARRIEHFPC